MARKVANKADRQPEENVKTEDEAEVKAEPKEDGKAPSRRGGNKPKAKKRHRFKPAPRALNDTRPFKQGGDLLIGRKEFRLVVRDITDRLCGKDIRFKVKALEALQCAAEAYLSLLFEQTNMAAMHARRVTIQPKDMDLVRRLRGDHLHEK